MSAFSQIGGWVKANPIKTGAAVIVGGIALYMLANSGGGGGSGQVITQSSGPNSEEIAAQTQIQLAQISAAATGAGYQAQLAGQQVDAQTQLALAQLGLQSSNAQLQATLQGLQIQSTEQREANAQQFALAQQQITSTVHMSDVNTNAQLLAFLINAKPKQLKALSKYGYTDLLPNVTGNGSTVGAASGSTSSNTVGLLT